MVGYKDVSKDDEQAMMSAVMQHPVSIAVETDQSSSQFYSSGLLTASCGTRLDMASSGRVATGSLKIAWVFKGQANLDLDMVVFEGECEAVQHITHSGVHPV